MLDWNVIVSEYQETVWQAVARIAPEAAAPQCFAATFLAAHQTAERDPVSDWRLLLQHHALVQALAALRAQRDAAPPPTLAASLRSQLAQLPEQSALLFCMRYLCSFSFQEIAMELRAPLVDMGARINQISVRLGRQLALAQPVLADASVSPAQQTDDLLENAVAEMRDGQAPGMPQGLHEQTVAALGAAPHVEFEKPPEPRYTLPIGIAAVLVVVVAGLIYGYTAMRPKPPAISFAQVAEALSKANSVSYRMTRLVRLPGQGTRKVSATIVSVEPGRLRETMEPPDTVIIWDGREQKALTVEELKKRATLRDSADMFEETRPLDALMILKSLAAADAKAISQTTIDTRRAQGFQLDTADTKVSIWADVDSRLPVMMEMSFGPSSSSASALFSDFVWNPSVSESEISLATPEGYELNAIKLNLKRANEGDLAKALGVAARLNGGRFPDQFDRAGMSQLIASLYGRLPTDKQSAAFRNASEALEADLLQLGRGWLFISEADNGSEWHYAGAGAFYGSDQPVLWYRPAGSHNYRIVDASLQVKPIAPDRLPDVPSQVLRPPTTRPTLQLR